MLAEIIRQEEFEGTQLAVIEHRGEEWFTAEDIGKALGFKEDEAKAIRKIYERNADEFEGLSTTRQIDVQLTENSTPTAFSTPRPR